MAYPIKYIENNLVFNHDGECFAYYELLPYNYSFLSPEQKYQVHDSFRQLIAQNRDGKIHALQISTESSIRAAQERSKQEVTGKLKDVACAKINAQTEALISMIGENQVDYRFFIGFKLLVNEQEVTMKQFRREAKTAVSDFLHEVNHKLMGDFVSMSNEEIWRFQKMEKLLESKISRRFKVRRLDKDDFGYLIEHLYGQTGTAYEDNALKGYLTGELQALNVDTVRKDIPVSSALTDFQIWEITEEKEQHYQVTYTVEQRITEGESGKTVRSAYQVTVYVDGSGNLTIIQNPTITSVPVKSGYTPKAVQSDGTVDSITTEEINEFLTTFFKLYPTATAKELTYYVNEGVLKPVGKEYIFSELVNPVYNRNGNQVTASLAVKYLDNQTMTTQVSQFDLVLEKNGENWKIVK